MLFADLNLTMEEALQKIKPLVFEAKRGYCFNISNSTNRMHVYCPEDFEDLATYEESIAMCTDKTRTCRTCWIHFIKQYYKIRQQKKLE